MLFSQFKANRLAELHNEQWGSERLPDLIEVFSVARPRRVLEIGCYRGVSTEFWALTCARVVAIDPWDSFLSGHNMDAVWREFQARLVHYPHVEVIPGLALSAEIPAPATFDLVYLDGDHSCDAVKREIERFLPMVVPGGYIGGHDYTETPTPGDGVKAAVDQSFGKPAVRTFSNGSWLVQKGE
jgi:predicted O-methyltransferase YrrM